eukprot:gene14919-20972_t
MGLEEEFIACSEDATKSLPTTLTNDEKLEMYALYKQGSVGDVNISCPFITDMKGRAKWFAWEKKKGTTKEDAQKAYIA